MSRKRRFWKIAAQGTLLLLVGQWLADRVIARYFDVPLPWTGGKIGIEIRNELDAPVDVLSVEVEGDLVKIQNSDGVPTGDRLFPIEWVPDKPYWKDGHWFAWFMYFRVRHYYFPLDVTYQPVDSESPVTRGVYLDRTTRGDCRYIVVLRPEYPPALGYRQAHFASVEPIDTYVAASPCLRYLDPDYDD